ncbi:MAG: aminoacyl-tRNA hydrolase [Candidatus Nealsonbacteria bacterium CG_4_10_14_0_8_um_filter_35_10]|uniref:Peptidyl-tRNA hydrolase n=2 Tax=Candidatus Nealsoniibacteriota TaxID=1817911 RepID=A0A2M7R856_9BACT|nr:MAG: aminoacyl-tRNA hydrolase [Parcubacteria group bacterium CG1_02_36_42]PIY90984.1 MAG: aminoacyl-tRNA hydrolase [Candidatus Nealsonbacteria bacterium CG_4_10_14_0_8_um_filter_35_10]PJB99355.1 MAG: aminoacyl-tRNA hydrolase [Candidatus Nealsonbacteria bacterium CG_4_9_14_0_8_um_filter_35_12]
MILIVGLGNPGKKFEKTRHNLGFRIIDEFQRKKRDVHHFSDFRFVKKFNSLISEGISDRKKVILAKPKTFMNNSGKAVKKLISNIQNLTSKLWVIHDDIDLPLGKIKIVKNRGAAGHKGVQSIIDELGTKNFVRFRIGIRPKNNKQRTKNNIENFVLERFSKNEERVLKGVIERTCKAIELAIKEGIEKAMQRFNC